MGVLDMFLNNHDLIGKGFNEIRGIRKYIVVTNEEGKTICFLYDIDGCRDVIEKYLKENDFDKTIVKFDTKSIKNKDEELEELMPYKLVLLDMKLVLYKDIELKAKEYEIKGYTGKRPKFGINKYELGNKII